MSSHHENFFSQFKLRGLNENTKAKTAPHTQKPLLSGIPSGPGRAVRRQRRAGHHRIPYIGGGLVVLFPAHERIPLLFLKMLTRTHTSNKNSSTPTAAAKAAEARAIDKCFLMNCKMERVCSAPSPPDTKCL